MNYKLVWSNFYKFLHWESKDYIKKIILLALYHKDWMKLKLTHVFHTTVNVTNIFTLGYDTFNCKPTPNKSIHILINKLIIKYLKWLKY